MPPVSGVMYSSPAPDDLNNAAARLAKLQFNSSPVGNQSQQQANAGGAYAPGYGGSGGVAPASHLTLAPVIVTSGPPLSSASAALPPHSSPVAAAAASSGAAAGMVHPSQANMSMAQATRQAPQGGSFAPGYGPPPPPIQAYTQTMADQQAGMYSSASPINQLQDQGQGQMRASMDGQAPGVGGRPAQQFVSSTGGPQPLVLPPLLGPLLQFVDVELETALWRGSVLVLTNESLLPHAVRPPAGVSGDALGSAMHAGPTPMASTLQTANLHVPVIEVWDDGVHGPGTGKPKSFAARAIYTEPTFKYTFWRADIELLLPQESEVDVVYQIHWGADEAAIQSPSARPSYTFRLPAQASQWRTCVTSNAQFQRRTGEAARVGMRGSGPVFRDMIAKHRANPFHVWLGTGGQFSGEGVWDDCEHALRPFLLPGMDHTRRAHVAWTNDMAAAVERWYFLEYLRQWFGVGVSVPHEIEGQICFRQAAETIPYSFTPDSDVFPEHGSHVPVLHFSPVYNGVAHVGSLYYALFQAHTTPTLAHNEHGFLAEGYHSIKKMGPYTALLTLDTRTQRQPAGIIDRHSYDMLFSELEARVPVTTTNLIVMTSNPVIFPRTKSFEAILRSANNTGLASILSFAVGNGKQGGRNEWVAKDRFGEPVAVTKLNDFWSSATHKSERAFVVHSLQEFSRRRSTRITFASGHVNCLSAGHFRTYTDSKFDPRRYPEQRGFVSDFRSMIQLTVSGIVQEPADSLTLRAYHFAGRSAPFDMFTEEKLYHTFNIDVNQLPPPNNNQKLLGRRSYGIIIEHDFDNDRQRPGLLSFFYVENETFSGTATPYIINIPPLRYPQLPAAVGANAGMVQQTATARPQLRPSVTYRGYTAAGAASAAAAAAGVSGEIGGMAGSPANDGKGDAYGEDALPDPYSYDAPGIPQQPSSPPPYTPVPMEVMQGANGLPPRTDGTYSSSYEHTAAWVQGNSSHTTGSDGGTAG
ncbi:hypothetical protein GGI07_000927, partial [Coemansia sp. Benny D115]